MIIYARSSPLHRLSRRPRRRRKGTDFKAPTLMFLVARRSVGGRTSEEEGRGKGHSLSLPHSTRQIIICAEAKRTAARCSCRRSRLGRMLRAEKTDEHKLPHFIDNQPRSSAARGMTTWSWGALRSRIVVTAAERQHYLHAYPNV